MNSSAMTIPIKKRIDTELYIDERGALYIQKVVSKNKGLSEEGKIIGTTTNKGGGNKKLQRQAVGQD